MKMFGETERQREKYHGDHYISYSFIRPFEFRLQRRYTSKEQNFSFPFVVVVNGKKSVFILFIL